MSPALWRPRRARRAGCPAGMDLGRRLRLRRGVRELPAQHCSAGPLRHGRRGRERGAFPGLGPKQLHHRRRHSRRRRHQPGRPPCRGPIRQRPSSPQPSRARRSPPPLSCLGSGAADRSDRARGLRRPPGTRAARTAIAHYALNLGRLSCLPHHQTPGSRLGGPGLAARIVVSAGTSGGR